MKKLLFVFLACVFCSSCSLQLYEPTSEGYVVYDKYSYCYRTPHYHPSPHRHYRTSPPPRHHHQMENRYQKPQAHKPQYQKPPQHKPAVQRPPQRPEVQKPQRPSQQKPTQQRPAPRSGGIQKR